jgi:hypothetical protein
LVHSGGFVFFAATPRFFPVGGGDSFLSAPLATKIMKSKPTRTRTTIRILVELIAVGVLSKTGLAFVPVQTKVITPELKG